MPGMTSRDLCYLIVEYCKLIDCEIQISQTHDDTICVHSHDSKQRPWPSKGFEWILAVPIPSLVMVDERFPPRSLTFCYEHFSLVRRLP